MGVQDLESQSCQLILRASLGHDEVFMGEAEAVLCKQECSVQSEQSRVHVKGPVAEHKTHGRG